MNSKENMKRAKARVLRYKKPILKDLNLETIINNLWDIQEECENIRWYTDSQDGEDSLINALDGDEDEAYEFKMAFAELGSECEMMLEDVRDEWIPECFDIFFVAVSDGILLGWDSYEGDYFRIDSLDSFVKNEVRQKLKRLTKDELIDSARQCMKIYQAYIGLQNRYDNLKAAIDILRNQNTGHLQVVKEIEKLYESIASEYNFLKETKWTMYTNALPPEAWIA